MADSLVDSAGKLLDRFGKPYGTWFLNMLASPSKAVEATREAQARGRLAEYLLIIFIVSTLIGVTIGAIIPGRPSIQSRAQVFVVVSLLWLFLSLLVHGFCRLLGGQEQARIGIPLMAQDLAFAYVASNFLTLLIVWVVASYPVLQGYAKDNPWLKEPAALLFTFQFLILLYMVPVTVAYAHGFKGWRWFMIAVMAGLFAVMFGYPVYAQHSC